MYIEGNALILGDSSYLEHHGILGQKWGVRRFQNKDGTRTAAGKTREDRRVLKKGTTVKRTSYGMYDETYDNKKYVSTNDDDAGKWSRYIGEAKARQGAVVFENEYQLTRDVAVATGKDICKIIDSEFKNADVTKLKEDTDYAARALRQDLNNMSREERVSLNFAMQTQSGKKIVKLLKKHGYDALEDDHGKNVSKDPVIILDPKKNMKRTRVTANANYYFDYINHTSIDDSPHLSHHGIKGQRWGVRRFQNKDGTRTAAGKARDAESLRSSQEAKNVNTKIHSFINKQLSSEDLDTGKTNYDFASNLIKDPDFEKVIMPVVQDIRQTKAKYGNKEPYEFTGDEHQAYMNDIDRLDNKTGELAITIGLAEKGEPHKKSTPPEGEYERVDMFRYALARYLDEHSPDGYSDEGDWIYHSSMEGGLFIEDGTLYLSHHGIRGQRWGVRRFQNRDGSLTNAGRKRLGYATKGAVQTVGKAFKAGVKVGGNAVKAVKAHHEEVEAKKKEKKKEKASQSRLGVLANKDLFTDDELRALNQRFKVEDELKMASIQKGVEIAKAVGTIASNAATAAKAYEDITGQSLSPIKRQAAELKKQQDAEDRARKIASDDAEEARKAAQEERNIKKFDQELRKATADADKEEFLAKKTKAQADQEILKALKGARDFDKPDDDDDDPPKPPNGGGGGGNPPGGGSDDGSSWVQKATAGGKNPFEKMIYDNDPEYKAAKDAHDEKVAQKERMEYLDKHIAEREQEKQAEKAAKDKALMDMINQSNARTGRGQSQPETPEPTKTPRQDSDALFSQKGSLPIDKGRYKNSRAASRAKQFKDDVEEERTKKQDDKAAKAAIDTIIKDYQRQDDTVRNLNPSGYDRQVALSVIKSKAKNTVDKVKHPVDTVAKKISDKAREEKWAKERAKLYEEYQDDREKLGPEFANETYLRAKRQSLQNLGYRGEALEKKLNENSFSKKKKAKHDAFSIQNGVLFVDESVALAHHGIKGDKMTHYVENGTLFINAGEPYLEHHGVLGMKWGKHLRAGKGPASAPASAGGGGGGAPEEDEETKKKIEEAAKKAGMSVAEFRTKMAGKIGGAAAKAKKEIGYAYGSEYKKDFEKAARLHENNSKSMHAQAKAAWEGYGESRTAAQRDNWKRYAEYDRQAKASGNMFVKRERSKQAYDNSLASKVDSVKRKARLTQDKAKSKISDAVDAAKKTKDDVKSNIRSKTGIGVKKDIERNARLAEGQKRRAHELTKQVYSAKNKEDWARAYSESNKESFKALDNERKVKKDTKSYSKSIAGRVDSTKRKARLTKDRLKSALGKSKQRKQLSTEGPKAKKQISNARDDVEKAARANENAYKHAKAVYRQTGSDSDAYKQAIKRSGTTLQRYIDSKKLLKKKKRAKHSDGTNAVYTEGTRLVVNSKWG